MKTVLAVFAAALILVVPTQASPAPSGSISLNQASPAFLDNVTFTTSFSGSLGELDLGPWIHLICFQSGQQVYGSGHRPLDYVFPLGPTQLWQGGAADCVADLGYTKVNTNLHFRAVVVASTEFAVSG